MAADQPEARDLARTVLVVLFILGLLAGSLWILRPFLVALICAATLAISTWPMMTGLQRKWGGRRGLAIAALMVGLTLAFLTPVYFGTVATVQSVERIDDLAPRSAESHDAGAAGVAGAPAARGPATTERVGRTARPPAARGFAPGCPKTRTTSCAG